MKLEESLSPVLLLGWPAATDEGPPATPVPPAQEPRLAESKEASWVSLALRAWAEPPRDPASDRADSEPAAAA